MKNSKALINSFACRSFRTTGDRDYIHARLAFRNRLFPQFQWSALHCLEKYLKCILLLNRIKAKKFKHEVRRPINRFNQEAKFQLELSDQTLKFIDHLETGARFRYLEVSWMNRGFELVDLDRAVFEIRKYCQVLDHTIDINGEEISVLDENLKRISEAKAPWGKNIKILDGWIEKILENKDHPARKSLIWNNLWFSASNRKRITIKEGFEAENSPLFMHPEIIDEVVEYIYLPQEIINAYKQQMS
jgi:hypothetical protein